MRNAAAFFKLLDSFDEPAMLVEEGRVVRMSKAAIALFGAEKNGTSILYTIPELVGEDDLESVVFYRDKIKYIIEITKVEDGELFIIKKRDEDIKETEALKKIGARLKSSVSNLLSSENALIPKIEAFKYGGISEYAAIAMQSTYKLLRLSDNIDTMLSEKGNAFSMKKVELVSFLEKIAKKSSEMLEIRGKTVSFETSVNYVSVFMDSDQISRAVLNLIANAAVYDKVGKEIVLRLNVTDSTAKISVKDSGDGISGFENYGKNTDSLDAKERSRGMGIEVVRKIAEDHDGTFVIAVSRTGTTATISIPLPKDGNLSMHAPEARNYTSDEKYLIEFSDILPYESYKFI